jgi:hypothetical protein
VIVRYDTILTEKASKFSVTELDIVGRKKYCEKTHVDFVEAEHDARIMTLNEKFDKLNTTLTILQESISTDIYAAVRRAMNKQLPPKNSGGPAGPTVLFELDETMMTLGDCENGSYPASPRKRRRTVQKARSGRCRDASKSASIESRDKTYDDPDITMGSFNLPKGAESCRPKDIIALLKSKASQEDVELLAQTKTNK